MKMTQPEDNTRKIFDTLKTEHQRFLLNIVFEAMNQTKAYMDAYPDITEESARRAASVLLTNNDMKEAKEGLLQELKEKSSVTFEWCANQLVEGIKAAKDDDKVDVNALKGCVNELNKMMGNHAAIQTDNKHTVSAEQWLDQLN